MHTRWQGTLLLCLFVAFYVGRLFYVFASGSPQPADWLLPAIALLALSFFKGKFDSKATRLATLLLGWVTAINILWYGVLGDTQFLRSTLFYGFNVVAFASTYVIARAEPTRFLDWLRLAAIASTGLELLVVATGDWGLRATGTFNNPNQLGYWAILNTSCLAVSLGFRRLSITDAVAIGASTYLCATSISRAALAAMIVLVASIFSFQRTKRHVLSGSLFLAAIALAGTAVSGRLGSLLTDIDVTPAWQDRFASFSQRGATGLHIRGYDRIAENFQWLLIGKGEGAYYRFPELAGQTLELHSSFGTILLSYGLIGLVLAMWLVYSIFRNSPWRHLLYAVPTALYGIAHNGLRFSWLWLLLGATAAFAKNYRDTTRRVTATERSIAARWASLQSGGFRASQRSSNHPRQQSPSDPGDRPQTVRGASAE